MLPSPSTEVGADLAAHHVDHAPGDRQAEAEALLLARLAAPVEALEDALDLRRRDPGSGVDHLQDHLRLAVAAAANGNGAGGWRVLEGVGEQADHHLAQQRRVARRRPGRARPRRAARCAAAPRPPRRRRGSRPARRRPRVSPAPSDSTRARVSSDWVRRFIRSASSARRSRKWSRRLRVVLGAAPAGPRSRRRSRPAGCAARGRRWRRSRLRRTRGASRRCGRGATASTARSSGSERACHRVGAVADPQRRVGGEADLGGAAQLRQHRLGRQAGRVEQARGGAVGEAHRPVVVDDHDRVGEAVEDRRELVAVGGEHAEALLQRGAHRVQGAGEVADLVAAAETSSGASKEPRRHLPGGAGEARRRGGRSRPRSGSRRGRRARPRRAAPAVVAEEVDGGGGDQADRGEGAGQPERMPTARADPRDLVRS